MATTFSLVVIFVPVSFMSSISGRFLYQFGITAAVAVLVSLLVSFTLTPMMSARLLRKEDVKKKRSIRQHLRAADFMHGWITITKALLEFLLARRRALIADCAADHFVCIPLYHLVPQEYIPNQCG